MERKVYVVLGMHRSNTSLTAGCLHLCGVDFGRGLLPSSDSNEMGHWELGGMTLLHDELLAHFGLSWDSVSPLPERWLEDPFTREIKGKLITLLKETFRPVTPHTPAGLKDPRMCRVLPLWREIFADLSWEPVWIVVQRHPASVIRSLKKRNQFNSGHALALWWVYNVDLVTSLNKTEVFQSSSEDFLAEPTVPLADWLARNLTAGEQNKVKSFCNPDLQHSRPTKDDAFFTKPVSDFYSALLSDWNKARTIAEAGSPALHALGQRERFLHRLQSKLSTQLDLIERAQQPLVAKLYWPDVDRAFSEEKTFRIAYPPTVWTTLKFECFEPDFIGQSGFRIDPSNLPGVVEIASAQLTDSVTGNCLKLDPTTLIASVDAIKLPIAAGQPQAIISVGNQPSIKFRCPGYQPKGPALIEVTLRFRTKLDSFRHQLQSLVFNQEPSQSVTGDDNKIRSEEELKLENDILNKRMIRHKAAFDTLAETIHHFHARSFAARYLREESLQTEDWQSLRNCFPPQFNDQEIQQALRAALDRILFDYAFVLINRADDLPPEEDPFVYYLREGWKSGMEPSAVFSIQRYFDENPDVAAAQVEPLTHYLLLGIREGRLPHTNFRPLLTQAGDDPQFCSSIIRALRFSAPGVAGGKRRKRILFVSGEPHTPGHHYRIQCLAQVLPTEEFRTLILNASDEERLREVAPISDVVWVWRATFNGFLKTLLEDAKARGSRVIVDLDDLMIRPDLAKAALIDGIRSMQLTEEQVVKHYTQSLQTFLLADEATAPTEPLLAEMRVYFKPASLIPNCFTSTSLLKARVARQSRPNDGLVRIGYASGSRTHQKDFALILPALVRILNECPETRLVVFPLTLLLHEFPELEPFQDRIETREMVPPSELLSEYARFDINLAPVEVGNPFCECKSEIKFHEAALVETVTVASPTKPFRQAITHGVSGMLANSPHEWYAALKELVTKPEKRADMARCALHTAWWNFGPDRQRRLLEEVLSPPSSQIFGHSAVPRLDGATIADRSVATETIFSRNYHHRSRVTVVVPVFNYRQYVLEALDSVAEQTTEDLDLIVVDDASTDDSAELVTRWMEENAERFGLIKLVRHLENSKLGAARNTGVALAETEFFFPLDADNRLQLSCLETCLKIIDRTGVAFVYTDLQPIGGKRNLVAGYDWDPRRLRGGNYIDAMALIRKSVWLAVGGYAPLSEAYLFGWEDYDFWCKCAETGFRGLRLREKLCLYRVHDESMLQKVTDNGDSKSRILDAMQKRHPWLDLSLHQTNIQDILEQGNQRRDL